MVEIRCPRYDEGIDLDNDGYDYLIVHIGTRGLPRKMMIQTSM